MNFFYNNSWLKLIDRDIVEEAKVQSWKWLRVRHKGLKYSLAVWLSNPTACLGATFD